MRDSMAEENKEQTDSVIPIALKDPADPVPEPEAASKPTTATVSGPMLHQVRIPEVIAIMPVRDAVAFPGAVIPLTIARDKSRRLLDDVMPGDKILGVLTQKNESVENPQPADMHSVGTVAIVLKMLRPADGQQSIVVHGLVRFRVLEFVQQEPYLKARVEALPDVTEGFGPDTTLLVDSVRQAAKRMIELSPNIPDEAANILIDIDSPSTLADFLAANLHDAVSDKLALLEETDVIKRLLMVRQKLATRIELLELEEKIQSQVRSSIDKNQRHYFLQEQIKAIQKELGQADEQSQELSDLKKRIDEAKVPEIVKKETDRELARLTAVPQASPEYGVIRSFLETVAELPWSKSTQDDLDINRARAILDRDHYDLEKIKRRIIEFLAVRKLNPTGRGPILCFLGPPGVGKTSLGKSIAESLGRKFVRMSLGGVRDEADIRGHRRTYVGSMPGRIIQELRKVGTNNPVMMLDEVDKLGADFRGDPSAALLEVLDPQQNNTFQDHYLGVPFDLSNIIFICTANYMEPVPPALRDRMEVIEIPGYTQQDKLLIARKYLIPRQLKENGVTRKDCEISSATLEAIIDRYTREAGVRNLERTIGSVMRGVAATLVGGIATPAKSRQSDKTVSHGTAVNGKSPSEKAVKIIVRPDDLPNYLGPPIFESEVALRTATPGVATGLAYTPAGGDILFVEATRMPGKGRLRLTGQIGNVMRESAHAAYSLLKSNAERLGVNPGVFRDHDVHVHVPAGAVPKDGPSAGVAMYTALASLFINKAVRPDVAMTGEITLRGLVLPIGGVKEKVIAAQHAGIRTVILPDRNEKNLQEVRQQLKKEMKFIFVKTVDEVLAAAINPAQDSRVSATGLEKRNGLKRKAIPPAGARAIGKVEAV